MPIYIGTQTHKPWVFENGTPKEVQKGIYFQEGQAKVFYEPSISTGPGPTELVAGNAAKGYFGLVTSGEMGMFSDGPMAGNYIVPANFAGHVGVTSGTLYYGAADWYKFSWQNEIWYIAQNIGRYNLTWDDINNAGAMSGTATLNSSTDSTFGIYLLTGNGASSMWDQLLRGLLTGGWCNTTYSDGALGFASSGNGYLNFCQEIVSGTRAHVRYGPNGASYSSYPKGTANSALGWRPALKLIQ